MKVNTFGLKTEVVPEMIETSTSLVNGKKILEKIDIPKDFSGYGRLKNIPKELSDINNKIKESKEWIEEKIISFDQAENNNKNIAQGNALNVENIACIELVGKDTKNLLDDPELQEELQVLNSILGIQKNLLKDNAQELENRLINEYNPWITKMIKNFNDSNCSFESYSDIDNLIFYLEDVLWRLKMVVPENENDIDIEIRKGFHDSDTENNIVYNNWFKIELGAYITDEDWKQMINYFASNRFYDSWGTIVLEFEQVINHLNKYKAEKYELDYQIYQLERYIELYPYTKITLKEDFKEYLERDYPAFPEHDVLTQEEKAIYFYLMENYSEAEAKKYSDSLEDLINQRIGTKEAFEYIKNLSPTGLEQIDAQIDMLITSGMGVEDGVVRFGENLLNLWPGNGEIMSATQYKQAVLISLLTQKFDLGEIEKQYGKDSEEYKIYEKLKKLQPAYTKFLGLNYNVASQIGERTIPMLVSLIPKIGPALGLALDSASDAGAVKTNAVQAGLKGWDLYLYMGIQGLTSAILTKTLGAIPGLSDNAGSLTLKGILKSSVQAGISGVAESKIDLFVTKIFTGEPVKLEEIFNLEEDAMTFLTGMCTAFILNGGKAIIVEYKGQKAKIEVDDLKKCLNEDGTLDVDKLIEKEIKNIELEDKEYLKAIEGKTMDELFMALYLGKHGYGVDQGMFRKLQSSDPEYFREIETRIIDEYNMSQKDARRLLLSLDSIGACSFAAETYTLLKLYNNDPEKFRKDFGYSIYRRFPDGTFAFNDANLLVDMYFFYNHRDNGGGLIENVQDNNKFTRNAFNMRKTKFNFQSYVLDWRKIETLESRINNFILSRRKANLDLNDSINSYDDGYSKIEMRNLWIAEFGSPVGEPGMKVIRQRIEYALSKGEGIILVTSAYEDHNVSYYVDDSLPLTPYYTMQNGGHATEIVGITEKGVFVSSWGRKLFVSFENLEANGLFRIIASKFEKEAK